MLPNELAIVRYIVSNINSEASINSDLLTPKEIPIKRIKLVLSTVKNMSFMCICFLFRCLPTNNPVKSDNIVSIIVFIIKNLTDSIILKNTQHCPIFNNLTHLTITCTILYKFV
jgi:hypothetical protein